MNRTITVKGTGRISVKPDTIRLNIDASGIYRDYEEAVKRSAEDTNVLREYISNAGVDPKELKTVHFDINSGYEWYEDKRGTRKRRFAGYKYLHSMYFKMPNDNELLGKVLYQLSKCPAEVEFSIHHTVKDVEAVKNELLANAVEDSKAKALVLAKAAGVQLGDVQSINYSWGELEIYSQPIRYGVICDCEMSESVGSYGIDIEADDIDVQDTVTIVWEIK